MTEIEEKIIKLASDISMVDVKPDAKINDFMDSLDRVEFMMAIEDEFNIRFMDFNSFECETVQDMINHVRQEIISVGRSRDT